MAWALGRGRVNESSRAGIAICDVILTGLARQPQAASATQHHHARCVAPENRTRGRLRPLRQHKKGCLMERHEILEAMSGLKLYGMRASFDEIAGKGLARRDEIYPLIASLIRAEHTHRQARSISYRIERPGSRFFSHFDKFVFADTPG